VRFAAQGMPVRGAGILDGFRESPVGMQPFIDSPAMQADGIGRRTDGGALRDGMDDLRLSGRKRRID
jgi:hypothetical protein